ncbi:hypothetical protein CIB48_g7793 [Xylaria polymorpha]|nr:hypothetical protein CIB48_g7793 [Xylaria polymorpha]
MAYLLLADTPRLPSIRRPVAGALHAMSSLPPNVHVSRHPCLLSKLSRLRSKETESREVKSLVHDIALIIGCEAFASALTVVDGPKGKTPIGYEYTTTSTEPQELSIVPILRSGLGMVDALLPNPVPVHHLGLYREPSTLEPVEYYNNLPNHIAAGQPGAHASSLAVVVDPVIATGEGVSRAAAEWPEAVEIWVAGVDTELTPNGMLKPGIGDIGDRIFLTIGK